MSGYSWHICPKCLNILDWTTPSIISRFTPAKADLSPITPIMVAAEPLEIWTPSWWSRSTFFNGFDLPLAGAVLHYDNHRRIPSFRFSFSAAAFLRRRRWADSYEFQVRLVLGRIRSWR